MPITKAMRRRGYTSELRGCVTWTRTDRETEQTFEVEGSVSGIVPASRIGHPDTWEPEHGGEVDVDGIYLLDDDGERTGETIDYQELTTTEALEIQAMIREDC